MKPTVGRIVHFYDTGLDADANNRVGHGPYAAIVTQVFEGCGVNLKVFVPFGDDMHEDCVEEKSAANASRYWTWPPVAPPAAPIGVAYGDRI